MEKFCGNEIKDCNGRREFLVKASAMAGGIVLSLAAGENSSAQTETKKNEPQAEELTIKLDGNGALSKIGGSQVFETKAGKIIVVRSGEADFVAFSAVCTHKGGPLSYDAKTKEFSCPWHGSTFGADGKNASGPADAPLKSFPAQKALVLSLKS